jgi:single-stranded-DNA-specific exonuclease
MRLDAEATPGDMTFEQVVQLGKLQQTGMGNPPVQLLMRNVTHQRNPQRMGPEKKHAKLWVTDGTATCEAVMWGVGERALPTGQFDLAFVPQINQFNGTSSIQLKVIDWRAAQ